MTVYQILDWDGNFENSRSRTVEICSFVAMPNKQHGMGLTRILSAPDGAAMFGIWCLILQACSRQKSDKTQMRDGWLTDNGLPDGPAWSAEDLALRWRRTEEEISSALELFCNPKICWIKRYDETPPSTARKTPSATETPPTDVEGKGRELNGKNGREGREREPTPDPVGSNGSTPQAATTPEASSVRKKFLGLLVAKGATMRMKDEDIFHEWCSVVGDRTWGQIQDAMTLKPYPMMPSELRKRFKSIEGNK